MVREEDTGKSRGFAFVKYEDARSCAIAVDNLIGSQVSHPLSHLESSSIPIIVDSSLFLFRQLLGRPLRIDHVEKYKLPKKVLEAEEAKEVPDIGAGHAYKDIELKNQFSINRGQDLFSRGDEKEDDIESRTSHDKKRKRKEKRKKKKDGRQKHGRKKEERREHGRREERRYDESSESDGHSEIPDIRHKKHSWNDDKSNRKRTRRSSGDDDVSNGDAR